VLKNRLCRFFNTKYLGMEPSSKPPQIVRELMSVGVATCSPDTPLPLIAQILLEKNLDTLVILDSGEGHALGIVGQVELANAFSRQDVSALKAGDIMRDGVPQVPPDIPLIAAVQIMQDQGVRSLFIMHHAGGIEYPAAFISYRHILRYLAAYKDGNWQPEALTDLGIKADRQSPLEVFIQRREAARAKNLPKKQ
jgi:predicted transcriptional regulator